MTIFLGTAGIPRDAQGLGTTEGIKTCARLGLNAMEIEFVQQVYMKPEAAREAGAAAKEAGVRLSIHAPFYINLLSDKKETIAASKKRILDSADRAEIMGADAIAIHTAFYGKMSSGEATEKLAEEYGDILDKMRSAGIKNVKLGAETMARESQWGTLDEVLQLHKKTHGKTIPYIDWAHLFARGGSKMDYEEILQKLHRTGIRHINSHFEGMKFDAKKKKHVDVHVPIGEPPFEPLAKLLVKKKTDITLICESPDPQGDALKMKRMIEKEGYRFK
ncbi:MAG: TIM barrel protein [Candidatus Aenigmarchaeota archaeon]|nr:TIM barrel protein [Candidatus Aenigmarchaeota archaeon]